MPIIEIVAPDSALSQGDILKDVDLFATGRAAEPPNGAPKKSRYSMCLILTRPCGIEHKDAVVVMAVEKFKDSVPREADNVKKVLSFLTNLRDGSQSPDVFYLGQLPKLSGRYAARFDSLHTIEIPPAGAERLAFIASKRIATLDHDFIRDLHTRLFRSVASLGFDDYGWLSDEDLEWVVTSAKADLLSVQAEIQKFKVQEASQAAKGEPFDDKALKAAEAKEAEIATAFGPYKEEHERRGVQRAARIALALE
jgi:hypothetical protein